MKKIEKHDGSFTEDTDEILNEFKCFYENLSQPKWKSNKIFKIPQKKFNEKFKNFSNKKTKSIEKRKNKFERILDDRLNIITELENEQKTS